MPHMTIVAAKRRGHSKKPKRTAKSTATTAKPAARQSKVHYDLYDVKSTAGVARGGKAGPQDYGLSDEAQMTVLLIDKEHKVLMNMARRAPERQDFDDVRKAIDKLLGPSPVAFP